MDKYKFIEEPRPPVTEDWESITSRLGGTWIYAPNEPCQQCERELDPMWARVSSLMGEHTCEEIIEGVWEHTFTPAQQRPLDTREAMNSYLQPAIEQMEQRRSRWLEEYHQWSKESILKRLEESCRVMKPDSSLLRYFDYYPTIEIPPVGLRPLLAEGASPRFSPLEMHQATIRLRRSARRIVAAHQERKRERRQCRATFRRRKRGLA